MKDGISSARNWLSSKGLAPSALSLLMGLYYFNANSDEAVYIKSRKIVNLILNYGWDIEYKFENSEVEEFILGKNPAVYVSNHHNIVVDREDK